MLFKAKKFLAFFDVRKKQTKTKKKKNGCSSLWYVGPMFISKEEKNQINLKM